jgi:hypothetical protein
MLREVGFSHFETRNAFGYRDGFIWVVNFQSFNSYNAAVLGCTTFSFGVILGVYVVGQLDAQRIPRDRDGRLRPPEYACEFRHSLQKRTAVDGFAREDIFFIDGDGNTTGACFDEVRWLVQHELPGWFQRHSRLHELIRQMEVAETHSKPSTLSVSSTVGSYNWWRLKSLLLVLDHEAAPSQISAGRAIESLNGMIGVVLDFLTIQSTRFFEEGYVKDARHLWDHLGDVDRKLTCAARAGNIKGCLTSAAWAERSKEPFIGADRIASARKELWPQLRRAGFTRFTERLAHRVSPEFIEVVEMRPVGDWERKDWSLPRSLFRVGVGIFWTGLDGNSSARRDRDGNPRPVADECHVSNWLMPRTVLKGAGTVFQSMEEARDALRDEALAWFEELRDPRSALALFAHEDWELFWCSPMMRGYGAKSSPRRALYRAELFKLLGRDSDAAAQMVTASSAEGYYPGHLVERYREWFEAVRTRFEPS